MSESKSSSIITGKTHEPSVNEHYALIGKIACSWSSFELILDMNSLKLANFDIFTGTCFTAQVIGPARKLDAYISLAKHLGAQNTIKCLNKFAHDTASLAERRNRVIHDPWLGYRTLYRWEITARKQVRRDLIPVSITELNEINENIIGHIERFELLHAKVTEEISTCPNT